MPKHNAFLHIGPGVLGVASTHAALVDNHTLARAGLAVPRLDAAHMQHADLEIRRLHQEAGLRRKDVEGAWAEVCRQAYRAKRDVVISQPGLVEATDDQAALAYDGLFGFRVHLVLTPPAVPDDLEAAFGPWTRLVRKQGRRFVVPVGAGMAPTVFAGELARLAHDVRRERAERALLKRARRAKPSAA
ncbi:MAG: hypothetical protein AVDCRST_MAG32-220 [uncultured Nocardioides sp.]|uniref:Uncharacterized protein n=1 Tax=uncultured Nocardioides sp. TaxID=198441 RepID=A0A6J4MSC4_9ACTN|nr:MAG: hypothetical protein AVDCRST_MAG32-220 [uncultured Nocardioides sp.]